MKKENPGYMTTQKERLSYWTYFVGQNVYYNITFIYLSAYLAMQWKVSLVLLIVKIWDAVNDPIFGYIFDKVKFKNGQKSLPWLRIAVAFIPVVTIAVFAIPNGFSETGKLIWFAVAYLLWDTIYTLTDVPAYSMLNTMTDNLQERNLLLSVNRVFSGAGYLLCVIVMPPSPLSFCPCSAPPPWCPWCSSARSATTILPRTRAISASGRCLNTWARTSIC